MLMWAMVMMVLMLLWAVVGLASALYWIDYDKVPLAMNVKGIRDAVMLGPIQWWLGKTVQEDVSMRQGVQFPRLLLQLTAICLMVVLSGCINMTTKVQENLDVPAKLAGRDCSAIVFGLGFGEQSVTQAMANASIRALHSVSITDRYILFGGNRCVEVVGE